MAKSQKQEISLLPSPIYHITNDSINNYIFSFLVLVEFDNFEILMDDACFGDIYKFKQAFGLTLVEPSKKTMLYIILQDQKESESCLTILEFSSLIVSCYQSKTDKHA